MSSSSLTTTRRRSVSSIIIVDSGEEDLTKSLLAPKTPNIISKRRGSVVSINSATSTATITTTFSTNNNKSIKIKTTTTKIAPKTLLPMEIEIITIDGDNSNNSNEDSHDEDVFHDDLIFNNQFHASKSPLNHSRSLSQPTRALFTLKHSKSIKINDNDSYLISSSNINHDTHSTYKKRTKLTSQKLSNFFGTKPPIDICVKEIEKEGLKAILNSKIPLCYFLYSLLEEYSSENLFFFLEVEQYESRVFDNSTQQLVIAQQIFDTYLTRNSQFEVNVDDKVRKSIIATIKSERDLHHCFRDAKHAVFTLLECSFSRFIRSYLSDVMKKEIGQHTAHYSREAYETAVSWLFKYLEKLGPIKISDYINHHRNNFISNNNNHHHHHNISSANHLLQKFLKSINNSIINNNNDGDTNNSSDTGGNTDFSHLTNLSKFQPLPSPNSSVSKKRNEMIKNMTLEFITNLLEIDISELYYYELIHKANKNNNYDDNSDDDYHYNNNNIDDNNDININDDGDGNDINNNNNSDNNMILQDLEDLDMLENSINSDSTVSSTNSNEEFKSLNQTSNYEGWDIDNDSNNSGGDSNLSSGKKRELKYRKSVKELKNPFKKTQRSKK